MGYKVDLEIIAQKLEFDLEDVEMIFGMFLETAAESIENIKKGIDSNDMDLVFQSAHAIKGSAANLTLEEIADLAKVIEQAARESEDINYNQKYEELKNIIENIEQ